MKKLQINIRLAAWNSLSFDSNFFDNESKPQIYFSIKQYCHGVNRPAVSAKFALKCKLEYSNFGEMLNVATFNISVNLNIILNLNIIFISLANEINTD